MDLLFLVDCNSLEINGLNQRVLWEIQLWETRCSFGRNQIGLSLGKHITYSTTRSFCVYLICVRCVCVSIFYYPQMEIQYTSKRVWVTWYVNVCHGVDVMKHHFSSANMSLGNTWAINPMVTCYDNVICVASMQLDPQALQGKDWQRTVIPMNGVSESH